MTFVVADETRRWSVRPQWIGDLKGALQAGERAADEFLAALGETSASVAARGKADARHS